MYYLIGAVAASTTIYILFKLFGRYSVDSIAALSVNYLIGALFGVLTIGNEFNVSASVNANWFLIAVGTGLILIVGFLAMLYSTQKTGMALTSISGRMSVVISASLGIFLLGDSVYAGKIAGIILALLSLFLTLKREGDEKFDPMLVYLPLTVFILAGMNDSIIKLAQHFFIIDDAGFIGYTATSFFFAFLFALPVLLYLLVRKKAKFGIKELLAGIILGVINWYSIYYLVKGLSLIEVSVFIPILNISIVVLTTAIGFLVFREKLNRINWMGIVLSIAAIWLISSKI